MKALSAFLSLAPGYLIQQMRTIEDIRHSNFIALIEQHGGIKPLADVLERTHSQLSQWKTRAINSGTGKPRNISGQTCRYIEKRLGLPELWMDVDRAQDSRQDAYVPTIVALREEAPSYAPWPFRSISRDRLMALPEEARHEIDQILGFHVSQWESKTGHRPNTARKS